jgi:hypothetical protein
VLEGVSSVDELNEEEFVSICNHLMDGVGPQDLVEEIVEVVMAMSFVHCWVNESIGDNEQFWMRSGPLFLQKHRKYSAISSPTLYGDLSYNFARRHVLEMFQRCGEIHTVVEWLEQQPLLASQSGLYTLASVVIQLIEHFNLTDEEIEVLSSSFPENQPIQRKVKRVLEKRSRN